MKSPRAAVSKLPDSVYQRLNLYALGAAAAGVTVLASAQPSEAKIVYTPTNVNISGTYNLDVNNDGIVDFTIQNSDFLSWRCIPRPAVVSEQPAKGNGAEGSALMAGARIGQSQSFYGGKGVMAEAHRSSHNGHCGTEHRGPWFDVKDRYLGLAFQIHGKTHYGWARLSVELQGRRFTATLAGYAYETIPGKSIIAGRKKGPDENDLIPDALIGSPIPDTRQHASLGMLALGVQGIPLWRRKEEKEA